MLEKGVLKMNVNSRIIVQSDWEQTLRDRTGKIWLSFKKQGRPTVQGEVTCRKLDDSLNLSCTAGFTVEHANQKLIVTHPDGEREGEVHKQQFQSPSAVFNQIHTAKKNVYCLDVTAGGLGVSCDSEDKIRIWTTENGEVRRALVGHSGEASCCRFFPSGVVVGTGGIDTQVKIWSAEDGSCPVTLRGHRAGITDLAIVDRGRNIVSTSRDGCVKLWDCGQATCITTFDGINGGVINGCSLGCPTSNVALGRVQQPPGEREVGTEDKLILLACQSPGSVQGYGLGSRTRVFDIKFRSAVNCCCFISDTLVACGTDESSVSVIDLRNLSEPVTICHEARSAILSLVPYLSGCFVTTGDGSCFLVDKDLKCQLELTGSDCDPLYHCAYDGSSLFTSCRDGLIRKYRL